MADINDKFVLYYAVRGYSSGEVVTIDIFDTVGTKEINSQAMTEINSLGIYSFNWFPRKRTSYLVVMNCAAKPRQQHQVIKIEKPKLSGAINIPRTRFPEQVFKDLDKKRLFKELDMIPKVIHDPIDYTQQFAELNKKFQINQNSLKRYVSSLRASVSKEMKCLKKELAELSKLKWLVANSANTLREDMIRNSGQLTNLFTDEVNTNFKLLAAEKKPDIEKLLNTQDEIRIMVQHG